MPNEYQTAKEARRDTARLKRADVRTKGRIAQETASHKAKVSSEERRISEFERQQTQAQRSALRQEEVRQRASQRIETQKELAGERRQERATNAALFGTGSRIASSSIGQNLGVLVALFFVMLIVYLIVTNGKNFGNLTGSVGDFIRGLSSNAALFVKNTPDTATTTDTTTLRNASILTGRGTGSKT